MLTNIRWDENIIISGGVTLFFGILWAFDGTLTATSIVATFIGSMLFTAVWDMLGG